MNAYDGCTAQRKARRSQTESFASARVAIVIIIEITPVAYAMCLRRFRGVCLARRHFRVILSADEFDDCSLKVLLDRAMT